MLCFRCGGEHFVKKMADVEQLYRGNTYIVNTPVSECVDCGWQGMDNGEADELVKRTKAKWKDGLCSHCQKNPASEPHTCPYAEEIADDSET